MKRALSAISLLVLSLSAHADFDAHVSISGLNFELIDLDLNDGISPSISFGYGWGAGGIHLHTAQINETLKSDIGAFTEINRSLVTGPLSGQYSFEGGNIGAFATRTSIHSDLDVIAYGENPEALSGTTWRLNMEVSANTLLKVSATGKIEALSNLTMIHPENYNQAEIGAELRVYAGIYGSDKIEYFAPGNLLTFSEIREKTLSVTMENDWNRSQPMSIYLNTYAYHTVSEVPEPTTAGLIACGLLLLGTSTRVRRTCGHKPASRSTSSS
ncbi:hypothetical protein [Pelomonas sp. Root1217]|uniref:hypothetical protein n=1 Tax=Pelomonas sp. Root1217 TaxID=1736430 RepID=UPI000B2FF3BA|nr:hypothetical protein [Pelomonas sp. Root1217]